MAPSAFKPVHSNNALLLPHRSFVVPPGVHCRRAFFEIPVLRLFLNAGIEADWAASYMIYAFVCVLQ